MKQVDPSIVLIASGLRGQWDMELLAHAAEQINLISEHDYAPEGNAHVARPEPAELARLATVPAGSVLPMLARSGGQRIVFCKAGTSRSPSMNGTSGTTGSSGRSTTPGL